jgi:hypothetical protein
MRMRALILAGALSLGCIVGGFVSVGHASTAEAAVVAANARPASAQIADYRVRMSGVLSSYLGKFGSRLTDAERARVDGLVARTTAELKATEKAAARVERLASARAPKSTRVAAGAAAVRSYRTGLASAQAAFNEMAPVLQPKLSFLEALDAKMAFDREMGNYEALGDVITSLAAAQNK